MKLETVELDKCPHNEIRRGDQLKLVKPSVQPTKNYCLACGREV